MGVTETLQEALWEAGILRWGWNLSLGHQGKLPGVEGELSLEDGLKEELFLRE